MAQLEYGDFYKFVASAGITLVAGAFAVPWLFLREPFDLTMDASKLKTLTPIAQGTVMHRQFIVALILSSLPWVSAALAIVGLVLTICGLVMWYRRQGVRDRGEEAATKKAEQELQQMTALEVSAKARQELASAEEEPLQLQIAPVTVPVSAVNAYIEAEKAIFARMTECLGRDVLIETNKRVGNVEYDAIVGHGPDERVIVEVKYIRKGFNSGFLTESMNGLIARTALYNSRFSMRSRAVLVIILASPNSIFADKIENLKASSSRPASTCECGDLLHREGRDSRLNLPTSATDVWSLSRIMWRELPIGVNSVSIRQSSLRLSRGGKTPTADIWPPRTRT